MVVEHNKQHHNKQYAKTRLRGKNRFEQEQLCQSFLRARNGFWNCLDTTKNLLASIYTEEKPEERFGPKPGGIFSREEEEAGAINWQKANDVFSCIKRTWHVLF